MKVSEETLLSEWPDLADFVSYEVAEDNWVREERIDEYRKMSIARFMRALRTIRIAHCEGVHARDNTLPGKCPLLHAACGHPEKAFGAMERLNIARGLADWLYRNAGMSSSRFTTEEVIGFGNLRKDARKFDIQMHAGFHKLQGKQHSIELPRFPVHELVEPSSDEEFQEAIKWAQDIQGKKVLKLRDELVSEIEVALNTIAPASVEADTNQTA